MTIIVMCFEWRCVFWSDRLRYMLLLTFITCTHWSMNECVCVCCEESMWCYRGISVLMRGCGQGGRGQPLPQAKSRGSHTHTHWDGHTQGAAIRGWRIIPPTWYLLSSCAVLFLFFCLFSFFYILALPLFTLLLSVLSIGVIVLLAIVLLKH